MAPAVNTVPEIEPTDAAVADKVKLPETAPVLAMDKVKVVVFWPETILAPRAIPVPIMDQPLQLAGVAAAVVIVTQLGEALGEP